MGQLNYRLTIIESILNRYLYPLRKVKRGWLSDVLDPVHLKERHFSAYIQPSQAKAAPTRKRFICCRKQGKKGIKLKKDTRFWCRSCNKPLCAIPCFEICPEASRVKYPKLDYPTQVHNDEAFATVFFMLFVFFISSRQLVSNVMFRNKLYCVDLT